MGNYYNPPDGIAKVARRLDSDDWVGLQAQLQPGEVLLGLFDVLGHHHACPHAFSEEEYEEFQRAGYPCLGYFAAKPEAINAGMDQPL